MNSINKLFSALLLTVMLTSSQGLLQLAPAAAAPNTNTLTSHSVPIKAQIQTSHLTAHQPSQQAVMLAYVKAARKALQNNQTSEAEQDLQAAIQRALPASATAASASKPLNTLKSRPLDKAHPSTGVKPLPPDEKTLAELQKAYNFLKQGQVQKSDQALQALESRSLAKSMKHL